MDKEFERLCEGIPEEEVDKIVDSVDVKLGMTIDQWFARVNRKLRIYRKQNGLKEVK